MEVDQINTAVQSRMCHIKESLRKYKKEMDTLVKLKDSQNALASLFKPKEDSIPASLIYGNS